MGYSDASQPPAVAGYYAAALTRWKKFCASLDLPTVPPPIGSRKGLSIFISNRDIYAYRPLTFKTIRNG